MIHRFCVILLILVVSAVPFAAQTRPANELGVSAGHEHLRTMDVEAATKFWSALGGEPAALGTAQILKFPGVFFMFQNANPQRGGGQRAGAPGGAAPTGTPPAGGAPPAAAPRGGAPAGPPQPSEGSTVEAIGFKVKSLKDSLAKWEAAGIKPLPGATARQAFLMSPENVKVQISEDPSITTSIATDEILMKVPNAGDASAWYAKWFGAKVNRQGQATIAQVPGMNIRIVETKDPVAGTQGRAIDHIGFEVKNLEAFAKKLADGGVTFNRAYAAAPATIAPLKSIAFITDPWGTYIELNEGFADVK